MVWPRWFWLKLQTLFRRNRNAQRLNDEMQFHLDQQIAENISTGMSRQEARYAAMRAFGNPTVLKEETRDTWGWLWLEQIAQDFRYGLRMPSKNSSFTVVAALTLALGIGATQTKIFATSTLDVPSALTLIAVLGAAAGLASYLPAHRAARVDPMVALRYE
jgi:hypothetical protein